MMSIIGLNDVRRLYKREKEEFDRVGGDKQREADVQVYWQRAELARAEIESGHPSLNAQALIGLNSALDAMVEQFTPAMRDLPFLGMLKRAEEQEPEAAGQLTDEVRENLMTVLKELFEAPEKLKKLTGSGVDRYEVRLSQVGLGAPDDRPIPADLNQALTEVGAIRDVLIHRAARLDEKAKEQAPTLAYEVGDLIRLSDEDHRIYSAAIRCYGWEVVYRSYRHWPEVSDVEDAPDLENWRGYYIAGA